MAYTPAMQQYLDTKKEHQDCILFFRMGDFYEMFFDDAVTASRDMDIVLTRKACGNGEYAPMCGVPYHAVDSYIAKLIDKGHKVAIAEQMEDPALAKGIVKREVIRVVTPGTVIEPGMLKEGENNFLACVYIDGRSAGLSWADISTGEFSALQLADCVSADQLFAQLSKIEPKEIITNVNEEEFPELWTQARVLDKTYISVPNTALFGERSCRNCIREHFKTASEKSVGLAEEDVPLIFHAAGALLGYLRETQKQDLSHMREIRICSVNSSMSLDKATIKNLELTETLFEHKVQGSLFGVLDRTRTAMGARKMKQWLREPLNVKRDIDLRLDAVEALNENMLARNDLRQALNGIYDLERLCARISLGTANARDLLALKTSLSAIPDVKAALEDAGTELLDSLNEQIDPLEDLCSAINEAIVDEPPFSVREGGMIRPGFSEELDGIIASVKDSREWIAGLEASEKERTGIKNLRVGYNKVFGYYIEISKGQTSMAPENYIRKQTLVNGERYITPELKEAENLVLNAQAKINDLEYRIFCSLRDAARDKTAELQQTSQALAAADVLCAFAQVAAELDYVRPEITEGDEIMIKKGRHPVIERTIRDGVFVSNDVYLDRGSASMLLITGPNMAGKSTYMRQLALIVLMAQAGCFVPALEARIGICDRIYTRIGASDNIAMGQSTFFVEMSELAYILNTATEKSLVILDEIGRGTSTYDGLSIAWAVVEYLTDPKRTVRTLFATHYHELTALSGSIKGVKNLNVDVAEENGNIVFLHKIVEGSASRSYGIHVAKLAGVPKKVLKTAEGKLSELESGYAAELAAPAPSSGREAEEQISLFQPQDSVLAQKVRDLDLMNMTPSQAIRVLEELQEAARDE